MPKKVEKEIYVRVCPNCKSPDVEMDTTNSLQPVMGLPQMYVCNKCEHTGYSFPEVALSDLKDFEEEVDEKHLRNTKKDDTPLVDTSYGKFEVHIIWKITAPLLTILGLFMFFKNPFSGAVLILIGLFMLYTTYFKMR